MLSRARRRSRVRLVGGRVVRYQAEKEWRVLHEKWDLASEDKYSEQKRKKIVKRTGTKRNFDELPDVRRVEKKKLF